MNDTTTSENVLNFVEEDKLPSNLNVLTILTFIWCAISLLITIATPALFNWSKGMMDKAASSGTDYSAQQLADMDRARQIMDVTQQNMIPLMVIGFIGIVLCFVGALWMRKLRKDGYWLYVAGELLPVIGSIILLGKYEFADWKSYIGLAVPIVFIILYTAQKKYLVK